MRLGLLTLLLLLTLPLDINASEIATIENIATTLPDAAERMQWSELTTLLNGNTSPNATQPDGMSALHWAVMHDNSDAVSELLLAGTDVNLANDYRITPLAIAVSNGNPTITKLLISAKADVEHELAGGQTLLMIAARTGNSECIEALLAAGAKVNATQRHGQTALMWAAAAGNGDAIDVLLQNHADAHVSLQSGFTAALLAARQGHWPVLQKLLKAGVDVNAVLHPQKFPERAPRDGMSALLLAVESGHFETAINLIEAGADPNDQRSGFTPLHAISWVRKTNVGDDVMGDPPPRGSGNLTSLQFVRSLVENGADVNLQLADGKGGRAQLNSKQATPFLWAARGADLPLMQVLVGLGCNTLLPNVDGCTPLMACAGVGVVAVGEEPGTEPEVIACIEFMLAHGAEVNTVDGNLETAMHGAAYRNFPQVVSLLSQRGSTSEIWDHKNKWGWTPLKIAQGYRPGSFKPSPETVAALEAAMRHQR